MKRKNSISLKMTGFSILVVILTVTPVILGAYLYLSKLHRQKEESFTLQKALTKAQEVDLQLQSPLEKSQTLAKLLWKMSPQNKGDIESSIRTILSEEKALLAFALYTHDGETFTLKHSFFNNTSLSHSQKDEEYLKKVQTERPFPLESLLSSEVEISSASLDHDFPLVAVGFPLHESKDQPVTGAGVAYISLNRLYRSFVADPERQLTLLDRQGVPLIPTPTANDARNIDANKHPLVKRALSDQSHQHADYYLPPTKGQLPVYGVFVRSRLGMIVVSEIPEFQINGPLRSLWGWLLFWFGGSLALALYGSAWLGTRWNWTIEVIEDSIQKITAGHLDVYLRPQIGSLDETSSLAKSFDDLNVRLREQAKVLSLMQRSLGKKTVVQLLAMKDEEWQGQKKNYTLFYCELQNFKELSETQSPEAIFRTFEDFFEVLCGVVEKHQGSVAEITGLGLLAAWEQERFFENAASNAVFAALDMRSALEKLNNLRLAEGQTPLLVTMAVNEGDTLIGRVGTADQGHLALIGETPQLAKDIKSSAAMFGIDLVVTESITEKLGDNFWTEQAGFHYSKGHPLAHSLFKVRGHRDRITEPFFEIKTPYSEFTVEEDKEITVA